ncbi:tetraspanin-7-like [Polypterus senegalus]
MTSDVLSRLGLLDRQDSAERLARRLSSPRGLPAEFGKPYSISYSPRCSPAAPPYQLREESLESVASNENSSSPRQDWPSITYRTVVRGRRRIMALLKLSLMGFSFVFWAAGLAMFTVGIWAKISLADYLVLSTNHYPNTPFILLTTGAAVIIWGFLGCFSAATENRCLLRMYGIFQLAVLVAGLSAGLSGLFYRKDIAEGFQKGLQEAIRLYTEDEVKADALDDVQRALDCCGVHSYQDWLFSPWSLDQEVARPNGSVPSSCCVQRRGCRNRPVPTEGAEMAGIHTHGCFQKVFDFVSDNMFHIATGALSLATIQVVGIVLTCLLAAKIAGPVPQERAPVH